MNIFSVEPTTSKNVRRFLEVAAMVIMVAGGARVAAADESSATVDGAGTVTWQAGADGVELKFKSDGSLDRLVSRRRHPVSFPDTRGTNKASRIAEMKAKAAIVRFIEEDVSTKTIVTEMENDMSDLTRRTSTAEGERITGVDKRQIMETVTQIHRSAAKGTLSGVVVLENGYDEETREAWVVVGISNKTTDAAAAARDLITGSGSGAGNASAGEAATGSGSGGGAAPARTPVIEEREGFSRRSNTDW